MKAITVMRSLFFIFLITGCSENRLEPIAGKNSRMMAADVKVTELNKSRAHSFTYYFDESNKISAAVGMLSIDKKDYPVRLIYLEDKSILVRQNDECMEFPGNYAIYGFIPANAVLVQEYDNLSFRIIVNARENGGLPVDYNIFSYDSLQESAVRVSNLKNVQYKQSVFEMPKQACALYEELIII